MELDQKAKKKSAFVVGRTLSMDRMPFGLCNAPFTFERLMEKIMAGFQWEVLLVYLNDIMVLGKTAEAKEVHSVPTQSAVLRSPVPILKRFKISWNDELRDV